MRIRLAALPLATLPLFAAGCAGYAIDYTKPKTEIVGAELARYGLSAEQSRCVTAGLSGLSVWQLRQLQIAASSVTRGYGESGKLTAPDLLWAARHVRDRDPAVARELARAAAGCGVETQRAAPPPVAAAAEPPRPPANVWFNLGAAPTGQFIAWDSTKVERTPTYRQAWFRVTNPGEAEPSADAYLLRVDCTARTINPMSARRLLPSGDVAAERDYGPSGEGAIPVESGTVMEIAYVALCY